MTYRKFIFILLILAAIKVQAQTCYELGLNAGRKTYNDAQKLLTNHKYKDAATRFKETFFNLQSTWVNCDDVPTNHELKMWQERCLKGIDDANYILNLATGELSPKQIDISPQSLSFGVKGGNATITVTTNITDWKIGEFPSWCSVRKSGALLQVTCMEDIELNGREGFIKITSNKLSVNIPIVQAGREIVVQRDTIIIISPPIGADNNAPVSANQRIQITGVQFAGRYRDGTSGNYGGVLHNDMVSLLPKINCNHLSEDTKKIRLDFKILNPDGAVLSGSGSGYTYSEEITTRGNLQTGDTFTVPGWGSNSGTTFAKPGQYQFEIWCSDVKMFSTSFEVVKRPTPDKTDPVPEPRLKTGFGIKGGLNLATINDQSDIGFSTEMMADFHVGIFLNFRFGYRDKDESGIFGLQPEVLYSRQSVGRDFYGDIIYFSYVTVPIMAKLYINKFNFEFGPYFGYLIEAIPDRAVINESRITLSDLNGGKDAGVAIGIGYEFNFGLVAGARYNYGLSDMAGNLAWKNQVIAISLGWKF